MESEGLKVRSLCPLLPKAQGTASEQVHMAKVTGNVLSLQKG